MMMVMMMMWTQHAGRQHDVGVHTVRIYDSHRGLFVVHGSMPVPQVSQSEHDWSYWARQR